MREPLVGQYVLVRESKPAARLVVGRNFAGYDAMYPHASIASPKPYAVYE